MKKMIGIGLAVLLFGAWLPGGKMLGAEDVKLLIPAKIYAVPGVEMNVYFQNVVTVVNPANYVFDVDCAKGRYDGSFRTALNDQPGTWKLTVRDVISGKIIDHKFEVVSK